MSKGDFDKYYEDTFNKYREVRDNTYISEGTIAELEKFCDTIDHFLLNPPFFISETGHKIQLEEINIDKMCLMFMNILKLNLGVVDVNLSNMSSSIDHKIKFKSLAKSKSKQKKFVKLLDIYMKSIRNAIGA